ncbi:Innexin, partial [Cooperia oncophora]
MLSLPSIFDILSKVDNHPAEDFIDRLNFGASVYLLAFFVLITGSKQHFGNPIQCMAPPESPDSWVHYYHDYCYIQDKLRIFDMNVDKSLAYEYEAKQRAGADYTPIGRFTKDDATKYWSPRVMYYQWVPYVLFLQAVFYLVPKLFWKLVGSHWCHGVDLETAIVEAQKLRTLVGEDRASALNNLAGFIRDVLESKRRRSVFGSSLASICYVVTKWLEVVNGFGQLYMLACFVGEGDYLWGLHLLSTVLNGTDNPSAGVFPRIVLCDVTKFALANLHQVNMQCVLMLNFINEKIYTFLWFWIVFVTVASLLSAIRQTVALIFPVYRSLIADNFLPVSFTVFVALK